jgi:hypothetical protein
MSGESKRFSAAVIFKKKLIKNENIMKHKEHL